MLRRLHPEQPDSFAFTDANYQWAVAQISKYPAGREASAVIPLLWRAQEQDGWLSKPAIETVADMLGMAYIRVLEVATFYFMFQLKPVGTVAHFQICGTLSCMLCGAEDLVEVCKQKIAPKAHQISDDGKFSWEEVECLGACSNAPMAQIGKDYFEDLTATGLEEMIDDMAQGTVPQAGPQNGRYAAEPLGGVTSLTDHVAQKLPMNASATLAQEIGDTIKRIDGTEMPLIVPHDPQGGVPRSGETPVARAVPAHAQSASKAAVKPAAARKKAAAKKTKAADPATTTAGTKPETLDAPKGGAADDLKLIKGVGPKLEQLLHSLGFFHYDQVSAWSADEIAWVDQNLEGFKGRVSRDDWVAQARILAAGGETDFSAKKRK